jgi:tRNA (guanine-N7-)-methyltransferase
MDPRPHHRFAADGRRMREVLSYSRRGSRLTPRQQEAWDAHHEVWVIPEDAFDTPGSRLADWFGREAPLVVEIGSGVGEATGVLAAARPAYDVLALEVWRPGVASSLAEVAAAGADNVRFCTVDAVWMLETVVPPGGLAELWTFFPDPWPKNRHHKRRLVTARFAALAATRLAPGARWRLATDWADYAEQMRSVLDAEPALSGGVVPRWEERPVTKFERKGVEAGRSITELCYVRG